MQFPTVTEISALSAHRREVELVRWSLMAVPEAGDARRTAKRHDPLRNAEPRPRAYSGEATSARSAAAIPVS
jgi:hypothetical protein